VEILGEEEEEEEGIKRRESVGAWEEEVDRKRNGTGEDEEVEWGDGVDWKWTAFFSSGYG
jgi:hypothetical protein